MVKVSTIITSNRSVKDFVQIFVGGEMAATAILDRLFHKAYIFNIDGHSYRLEDYNQTMKGAHLE
ncbi:MAG: ATP-binding protein [Methanosarcinaceae archaeon]|nr:ATP-binding protein [Methanosarcinaceae archaeon]